MSDTATVDPQLVDILCNLFGEKYRDTITPETDMDDIPEWDSLNFLNVVMALETAFGVTFSPDEAAQMFQVGHILRIINDVQHDVPHDDIAYANCLMEQIHKTKKDTPFNFVILSGSSTREGLLVADECQEITAKYYEHPVHWCNMSVSGLVVAETLQVLETLGNGWNGHIYLGIAPSIVFGCGTAEFQRSANHARFRLRSKTMEKILKANGYTPDPEKARAVLPLKDWMSRYLKGRTCQDIIYDPYFYPTMDPWNADKFASLEDFNFFYNYSPQNYEESEKINTQLFDAIFQWRDKTGIPITLIELTMHSSAYRHYSTIMGRDVRAYYQEYLDQLLQKYNVPYINLPKLAAITDADFRDPAHIYQGRRRMTTALIETASKQAPSRG